MVEVIVERPAALGCPQGAVNACVRVPGPGRERVQDVVQFQTTVRGLLRLRD
jgi:transposase